MCQGTKKRWFTFLQFLFAPSLNGTFHNVAALELTRMENVNLGFPSLCKLDLLCCADWISTFSVLHFLANSFVKLSYICHHRRIGRRRRRRRMSSGMMRREMYEEEREGDVHYCGLYSYYKT